MSDHHERDIDRIRAVIGDDLTDKLQIELGGQEIYFSGNPTHDAVVIKCIGVEAARAVALELGRGESMIPLGRFSAQQRTRADVIRLHMEGTPNAKIARATGVHLRTVERIVASVRRDRATRRGPRVPS